MTEFKDYQRPGNDLPPVTDVSKRVVIDRESMLYSYANTVQSSYTGDIRHYVSKFGKYLETKSLYYDPVKNEFIPFALRYAAPNLAFSDNKGTSGMAEEASIKDRLTLPLLSYYLTNITYDSKRAIDPSVRVRFKPKNNEPNRSLVTTAPRPTNFEFQVDLWCETREVFYQIVTAIQLDFNPYSYLTDLHDYIDETEKTFYAPYAKMDLTSFADNSNFVPGTDRRVVRGTFRMNVEGWITQPPTNTPYVITTKANTII